MKRACCFLILGISLLSPYWEYSFQRNSCFSSLILNSSFFIANYSREGKKMATLYPDINQREDSLPNIYVRDSSQIPYQESSVQENMHFVNFVSSAPYADLSAITTLPQQELYLQDPFMSRGNNSNAMLPNISRNFHCLNSLDLSSGQTNATSFSLDMQTPKHSSYFHNSKYLKAAQQLLDELVNVRSCNKKRKDADKGSNHDAKVLYNTQDYTNNSSNEISILEKQELQRKVEKLLTMVDQLEQRYKQYRNQIHTISVSFDALTRPESSKPYTTLALQTISSQFRCLKDAITSQISSIRRKLGEQVMSSSEKGVGISRLRYIDQKIRQERILQQFGMMQSNVWRPQRGLPENSVSVLRAWLFEHFLHPYPKDSEKLMLAKQTGLTRGQVANWFINARVRLWKPMIEEMYQEEIGEAENQSNSSSDKPPKLLEETKCNKENEDECKSNFTANANLSAEDGYTNLKLSEQMPHIEHNIGSVYENERQVIPYQMTEMSRFANGVSLTLGLQNCDVGLQNLEEEFEYINVPLHMMHDFVA